MFSDYSSASTVPYKRVLEVGNRLKKTWHERRPDAWLATVSHPALRGDHPEAASGQIIPPIYYTPQASSNSQRSRGTQQMRLVNYSPSNSHLMFRSNLLADPQTPYDGMLLVNSGVYSANVPAMDSSAHRHIVSPPANSTGDLRESAAEPLAIGRAPYGKEDSLSDGGAIACIKVKPTSTDAADHGSSKPMAALKRLPRIYSISQGCSPPRALRASNVQQQSLGIPDIITGAKAPIADADSRRSSRVSSGHSTSTKNARSRSQIAKISGACSTTRTRTQEVSQYVRSPAKSPLARPQALLPFNLRRTTTQFREEIMALGEPPGIKPMVMSDASERPVISRSRYDLKAHGSANLLKFDKLEFRVHRPPSSSAAVAIGSYHSNGVFGKKYKTCPHPYKNRDITGKNIVLTEFDVELSGLGLDRDVPFSTLLDVR